MGKSARNERRKIAATYLNNIAVACFVAGAAVPFLVAMTKTNQEMMDWILAFKTAEGFNRGTAGILTVVIAVGLSLMFHLWARSSTDKIED